VIFSSFSFLVFLVVTLTMYGAARSQRERSGLLLAASLIFYASWRPAYLLLLLASLGINYLLYLRLVQSRSKLLLKIAVALNLVFLGAAKYLAFLAESLFAIAGLVGLSAPADAPTWMHWALPLGISFYTFHMLSAMFDAYRGTWAKQVSFARWCLYVTFFPHLIAGPILRPGQLIDQLGELSPIRAENIRLGGTIFVAGLIKKVLFADNLAPIADAAFNNPDGLNMAEAWIGTLAFAFQIYFDFSGYSEMAIGLACLFGVVLPRNFLYPYVSRNPTEFWRRWHITLSQWLRDYLYIALGGNRDGSVRTYANLMTTMVLGGAVARRELDLRRLGRATRCLPDWTPPVQRRSAWRRHPRRRCNRSCVVVPRLARDVPPRAGNVGILSGWQLRRSMDRAVGNGRASRPHRKGDKLSSIRVGDSRCVGGLGGVGARDCPYRRAHRHSVVVACAVLAAGLHVCRSRAGRRGFRRYDAEVHLLRLLDHQ
jgi:D-alanyl-lipoteichoic acid acyltransferase DltB (MBOAT superfamily)